MNIAALMRFSALYVSVLKRSYKFRRDSKYTTNRLRICLNKDKKFTHYRTRYEEIKRRCEHKKAIIAIARMMLTAIYHI